ncbi:MAG: ribonuclease HI [Chitinophagales bacterium]|nr:ribonuclease HI [Chitinophagales bacterium]
MLDSTASGLVEIFTDGSSRGNPGPGGYGVILKYGKHEKEISKGFRLTTNNRMELMAVIAGLEALKRNNQQVIITSDSRYVVDAVEKGWVFEWEKKGFSGKKNPDLWKRFLELYKKHHIKFNWIKGHNQHPYNERCDKMATSAAEGKNLAIDYYFEENLQRKDS